MRLNELIAVQDHSLKSILAQPYQGHSPYHGYEDLLQIIQANFDRIPPGTREKYLRAVEEYYLLTEEEFTRIFIQSERELLTENGFYLFHPTSLKYFPPDDMLKVVLPHTSLVYVLSHLTKKNLQQGDSRYNSYGREELLMHFVRGTESPFLTMKSPPHYEPEELLRELGYVIHFFNKNVKYSERSCQGIIAGLPPHLSLLEGVTLRYQKLIRERIIFIVDDPNAREHKILCHPRYAATLHDMIEKDTQRTLEEASSRFAPPVVPPADIHHQNDTTLYSRRVAIVAAWLASRRLGYTASYEFRRAELGKLVQAFSGSKKNIHEERLLESLWQIGFYDTIFGSHGEVDENFKKFTDINFLQRLEKQNSTSQDSTLRDFLAYVPKDRWIALEDIQSLAFTFLLRNQSTRSSPESIVYQALKVITQLATGDYACKGKDQEVYAVRLSSKVTARSTTPQKCDKFTILPNLEIALPPDADPRAVYTLATVCGVKNLNTLTITQETLSLLGDKGVEGEKVIEFFERYSLHALPDNVRRFLHDESRQQLKADYVRFGSVIYVQDPHTLEIVKKELKDKILKVVDNRLVVLKLNDPYRRKDYIPAALKKHGIVVVESRDEKEQR